MICGRLWDSWWVQLQTQGTLEVLLTTRIFAIKGIHFFDKVLTWVDELSHNKGKTSRIAMESRSFFWILLDSFMNEDLQENPQESSTLRENPKVCKADVDAINIMPVTMKVSGSMQQMMIAKKVLKPCLGTLTSTMYLLVSVPTSILKHVWRWSGFVMILGRSLGAVLASKVI